MIIINAITLGLQTSKFLMSNYGDFLTFLDKTAIWIFVAEIAAKIYARGWKFFKSGWSVFDFIVVSISLLPAKDAYSVVRALRILRILRLISTVKTMRNVVEGLFKAIPGISSVLVIILILFYIFAVIGTKLFGGDFPDRFGTLGQTMFTLFQIMTLEGWSEEIVRPIMEIFPYAWIYFTIYILITTFTMVNLFIAVIVNAMHIETDDSEEDRERIAKEILDNQKKLSKNTIKKLEEISARIEKLEQKTSKKK